MPKDAANPSLVSADASAVRLIASILLGVGALATALVWIAPVIALAWLSAELGESL